MSAPAIPLTIGFAQPAEQTAALALVFADLSAGERAAKIHDWQQGGACQAATGLLWCAARGDHLVGALLVQPLPGNTWMIHPPRWQLTESVATGTALLNEALAEARTQAVCLVQALLPSATGIDADSLRAVGIAHATDLYYLGCSAVDVPSAAPVTALTFAPYSESQQSRLHVLLDATYQGTLDCPALNGVRNTADVLASYREVGRFDPSRWFIVQHAGQDIGCLLLAEHPAGGNNSASQWELVYMGLVPGARGHGWGVQIARQAQYLAGSAGCAQLVLAVDAANTPALAMYAAADFNIWDQRSLFLRVLNEPPHVAQPT